MTTAWSARVAKKKFNVRIQLLKEKLCKKKTDTENAKNHLNIWIKCKKKKCNLVFCFVFIQFTIISKTAYDLHKKSKLDKNNLGFPDPLNRGFCSLEKCIKGSDKLLLEEWQTPFHRYLKYIQQRVSGEKQFTICGSVTNTMIVQIISFSSTLLTFPCCFLTPVIFVYFFQIFLS